MVQGAIFGEHDNAFHGRAVIVTGGAQGIGMGIARAFAEAGARVAIVDIDATAGQEHAAHLQGLGLDAAFFQADVAQEADVRRLAADVAGRLGGIDVLVNNAGIGHNAPLRARSMEEWDRVLAVNLRAPYMMARYCADELEKNSGAIVNIASTRALMSEPDTEPYAASKGGLLALTHALAVSLGPKVRVNAISPGWIEVSDWKRSDRCKAPEHRPQDLSQHPAGRVGTPPDIAHACLFLASPAAGFITGANLVVDGGMTVRMIYEE